MKNIKDLRDYQLETLQKFKDKKINIKEARAVAYSAGKIIENVRLDWETSQQTPHSRHIDFLD